MAVVYFELICKQYYLALEHCSLINECSVFLITIINQADLEACKTELPSKQRRCVLCFTKVRNQIFGRSITNAESLSIFDGF